MSRYVTCAAAVMLLLASTVTAYGPCAARYRWYATGCPATRHTAEAVDDVHDRGGLAAINGPRALDNASMDASALTTEDAVALEALRPLIVAIAHFSVIAEFEKRCINVFPWGAPEADPFCANMKWCTLPYENTSLGMANEPCFPWFRDSDRLPGSTVLSTFVSPRPSPPDMTGFALLSVVYLVYLVCAFRFPSSALTMHMMLVCAAVMVGNMVADVVGQLIGICGYILSLWMVPLVGNHVRRMLAASRLRPTPVLPREATKRKLSVWD